MKLVFSLTCVFFCGFALHAQDITGIWRGYFYSGYGAFRQQYKYEVQINQLAGARGPGNAKAIKGVTYSYRLTSFYGKANFVGIYNDQTKEITLKEDSLVEVKMEGESFSCLMTCYLEYQKIGSNEVLQGSFSSVVSKKGTDCGSGTVYLERVQESDFHKEAFLMKKRPVAIETETKPKKPAALTKADTTAKNSTNNTKAKAAIASPVKTAPLVGQPTKPKKPAPVGLNTAKPPMAKIPEASKKDSTIKIAQPPTPMAAQPTTENPVKRLLPPVPDIIKQRSNPLVKTLVTTTPDILIEIYDNGEVDGDTITVYHNNALIVDRKGLSTKAITVNIKATPEDYHHEFVMVANNLGTIPPNTALMVVTTGGKRYELFISSDEQKNAKVVIDYQPPPAK